MYGKFIPNLSEKGDKYGFVNEHEVRVTTGLMLVLGFTAFFLIVLKGNFSIPLILVSILFLEFALKALISPKWSFFGILSRRFIRKKQPLWIGSVQKRFAWTLGIFLTGFVIFCILVLGSYIPASDPIIASMKIQMAENIQNGALWVLPFNMGLIACFLCLIFMWLESVVGYCVGCAIYGWLVRKQWMKKYPRQDCVDNNCNL